MAEAAQSSASPDDNDDGGDQGQTSVGYLTPLQKSLIFELTTRRDRIASARIRADFWQKHQRERIREQDAIDETSLDQLITERREELTRLKEARQIKSTIIDAADAAHAVNASMAAYPPGVHGSGLQKLPLSRQPLRYLAAERDELAVEYLRIDAQIKDIRDQRSEMTSKINAMRTQTSALIEQVKRRSESLQGSRRKELQSTAKRDEKSRALDEALQAARGKREMVKGVLRGLILESGLDWLGNQELRKLMLELGDDDLDASEDEPDFDSDSEGDSEG